MVRVADGGSLDWTAVAMASKTLSWRDILTKVTCHRTIAQDVQKRLILMAERARVILPLMPEVEVGIMREYVNSWNECKVGLLLWQVLNNKGPVRCTMEVHRPAHQTLPLQRLMIVWHV